MRRRQRLGAGGDRLAPPVVIRRAVDSCRPRVTVSCGSGRADRSNTNLTEGVGYHTHSRARNSNVFELVLPEGRRSHLVQTVWAVRAASKAAAVRFGRGEDSAALQNMKSVAASTGPWLRGELRSQGAATHQSQTAATWWSRCESAPRRPAAVRPPSRPPPG